MALFNNGDKPPQGGAANTTIITAGAKIKGEIELSCNLYIDGELEGSIKSSKEVNVGKNGFVKGTITTERLVIQGRADGVVDASVVDIKAKGHMLGEINSKELIIEAKALFEGNSTLKDNQLVLQKVKEI